MSPVTRQPEDNPYLRLPNPPKPPRTEEVAILGQVVAPVPAWIACLVVGWEVSPEFV